MDTKQEILSRLYSLRAGISVISQKADAIEDMNAKKEKRKKLSKDMILSAEKDINRKKGYMSDSKSYIASYKKNIKECEDDIAFGNSRKKEFERLKSENQKEIVLTSKEKRRTRTYCEPLQLLLAIGCVILVVACIALGVVYWKWSRQLLNEYGQYLTIFSLPVTIIWLAIAAVLFLAGPIFFGYLTYNRFIEFLDSFDSAASQRQRLIKNKKAEIEKALDKEKNIQKNAASAQKEIEAAKSKIANEEGKIKKAQKDIEKLEKDIKAEEKKCQNDVEQFDDEVKIEAYTAGVVYDALKKEYGDYVNISDWENLDLMIYFIETGRASDIKEALQLTDRQRHFEDINNSIKMASTQICNSINSGLSELQGNMVKCFSVVSNQINMLNEQQIKSNALLERINAETAASNERLKNIENLTEITNERLRSIDYNMAARAKAQESSAKMMEQINNNTAIQNQYLSNLNMYAEQADRRQRTGM